MPPTSPELSDQHPDGRHTPDSTDATATVRVRYFASARAASGCEEELVRLPDAATVADAVKELGQLHPGGLPRILDAASFLLNGIAVRDRTQQISDGAELDVLPPFAGG